MQNKSLLILGLVMVVGIGGLVFWKSGVTSPSVQIASPTPTATSTPVTPTPSGITLTQVATHNSRTSCWAAINSNVYDLTSWIPNHPGGEQNILQLCGTNGSAKFNAQHGGNAKVLTVLSGFKIGTLLQ